MLINDKTSGVPIYEWDPDPIQPYFSSMCIFEKAYFKFFENVQKIKKK